MAKTEISCVDFKIITVANLLGEAAMKFLFAVGFFS